jgi:hypothetical protein
MVSEDNSVKEVNLKKKRMNDAMKEVLREIGREDLIHGLQK